MDSRIDNLQIVLGFNPRKNNNEKDLISLLKKNMQFADEAKVTYFDTDEKDEFSFLLEQMKGGNFIFISLKNPVEGLKPDSAEEMPEAKGSMGHTYSAKKS